MCVHTKYTYSIYGDGYKVPQHPHKHTQTHTLFACEKPCAKLKQKTQDK